MSKEKITTDEVITIIKPAYWLPIILLLTSITLSCFGFLYTPVVFLIIGFWKFLEIYCWSYELGERTITERKGVFSQKVEEIHYFRVKSIQLHKPFWMRIVGLSNILITTSDPARPFMKIYAIPNGDEIRTELKNVVYEWRSHQNIREYDVN